MLILIADISFHLISVCVSGGVGMEVGLVVIVMQFRVRGCLTEAERQPFLACPQDRETHQIYIYNICYQP